MKNGDNALIPTIQGYNKSNYPIYLFKINIYYRYFLSIIVLLKHSFFAKDKALRGSSFLF